MKGNQEVIDNLNANLAEELTAVNQYILHGEMCANWGYSKLHEKIEKRAIDEMKHAEMLIERILFLEGQPIVSKLDQMHIGSTVMKQLEDDKAAEENAIKMYNDAVALSTKMGDNGSKVMVESILKDEEAHLDWIEEQLDQIGQMGYEFWLNNQI